jgi:hypothetical protein
MHRYDDVWLLRPLELYIWVPDSCICGPKLNIGLERRLNYEFWYELRYNPFDPKHSTISNPNPDRNIRVL